MEAGKQAVPRGQPPRNHWEDRHGQTDISSTSARVEVTTRSRVPTNKEIDHKTRFVLVTSSKGHANLLCNVPITPVPSIENLAVTNTPGSVSKKA